MAFRTARSRPAALPSGQELFDEGFLKKLEYLHLIAKKLFSGTNRADRRTRKVGSGIEFADHREYTAGDDLRYIDWSILGRLDRLLLRLFEEEEDLHIYLLLDVSDSVGMGDPPKLRYGMQVAAALAYVGLANLDRVSVVTLTDTLAESLPPARGKGRIFKIFRFLEGVQAGGKTDLAAALRSFVARNKRRGLAVLISDFYDPAGYQQAINVLRYNRFEPLMIQLYDLAEATPSLKGDLELIDRETGKSRQVTISAKMLEAYAREHARYCKDLADYCVSKQVPFLRADTSVPFDELILGLFRRGGFLR